VLYGEPVDAHLAREDLRKSVDRRGAIGIGSPRASLESNFALRALVGPERFFSGMMDCEARRVALAIDILRRGPSRIPTLHEMESCDAILVLGEDVTNSAPRIALTLRQSVRQRSFENAEKLKIPLWLDNGVRDAGQGQRSPLYVATPYATRLDDIAAGMFRGAPDDLARLGFAVAHALDPAAPGPEDIPLAREIASALKGAKRPLIVSGTGCGSEAVLHAAANVARACGAALYFTSPESNTTGCALAPGKSLGEAF